MRLTAAPSVHCLLIPCLFPRGADTITVKEMVQALRHTGLRPNRNWVRGTREPSVCPFNYFENPKLF